MEQVCICHTKYLVETKIAGVLVEKLEVTYIKPDGSAVKNLPAKQEMWV